MKKIKFVGLPILALIAIAGLASCAGESLPKQKPGVIFHASAALLKIDDVGDLVEQSIDFKDKECATVTINNEESLQYGKQDVEIFVEPKGFFTFRKYDTETWAVLEKDRMPAHPYVGLGSPVSLYNYPLQENVAWTFTDLSEQYIDPETKKPTGFYKEKYKITVKKEYFQKNIVVDYGNVESLNNRVYVYNSEKYSEMFKKRGTLTGEFKDYYELNESTSSYAAASTGATVTYNFSKDAYNSLYTFDGWDDVPTQSANSNADTIPYAHFKIYGVDKDKNKELLSVYKPGVSREEQSFIPTVIEGGKKGKETRSLSFFINWDLLAYGKDQGYAEKFKSVEVEIGDPTPIYKQSVNVDSTSGITVYPGDMFQHVSAVAKIPYKTDGTFITYDASGSLPFEDVLSSPNYIEYPDDVKAYYSTLFELPTENKDAFKISINGEEVFNVDLVYGENEFTNWRIEKLEEKEGETELLFWDWGDWHLVQLNPTGRKCAGLPEKFREKGNLYYLYALSSGPLSEALDINIELVTVQTTKFTLDSDSTKYGNFAGGATDITLPCGDKFMVEIPFQPKDPTLVFEVGITSAERNDLRGEYISGEGGKFGIKIRSQTQTPFGDKTECTITLTTEATKVELADSTTVLGSLADKNGNPIPVYEPEIQQGQTTLEVLLKLKDEYDPNEVVKDYIANIFYGGKTFPPKNVEATKVDTNVLLKVVIDTGSEPIKQEGGYFRIEILYANVVYSDNRGGQLNDFKFTQYVGKQEGSIILNITYSETPAEKRTSLDIKTNNSAITDAKSQFTPSGTTGQVDMMLNYGQLDGLPNGIIIYVTVTYTA